MFVKLRDQFSPVDPTPSLQQPATIRPAWPHHGDRPDTQALPRASLPRALQPYPIDTSDSSERSLPLTSPSLAPVATLGRVPGVGFVADGLTPPESASREPDSDSGRRFEMRLMHHFTVDTSRGPSSLGEELWSRTTPELAVQHSFLLDEILAMSALHLSKKYPEEPEYLDASYQYFQRALKQYKAEVQDIRLNNFEAVIIATLMISMHSFSLMGESRPSRWRERVEDSPVSLVSLVSAWYHRASCVRGVLEQCHPWYLQSEKLRPVVAQLEADDEQGRLAASHAAPFAGVLRHQDNEKLEPEDIDAYEKTLSYIGMMHAIMSSGRGASVAMYRLVLSMPAQCPSRFVALVQDHRPRALVLLAHAFAVSLMIPPDPEVWWVGGVFQTQITAIHDFVPPLWRHHLAWPLEVTRTHKSHG